MSDDSDKQGSSVLEHTYYKTSTLKQYYMEGFALTSFEHDSDVVRTDAHVPWSASTKVTEVLR